MQKTSENGKTAQKEAMPLYHIAIDGPVASGKGTVARELSKLLDIPYLDTGSMYRGIAVYLRDKGVDINNETSVAAELPKIDMRANAGKDGTQITVNGVNITAKLRDNEISRLSSVAARYAEVRNKLVKLQQDIALTQSFILEGRDICSRVLPDARFKFYLTASAKVRAKRRHEELIKKNNHITFKEMLKQIKERDRMDKKNKLGLGGFRNVRGAMLIDSSKLTIDEAVQKIYNVVRNDISNSH